MEMNECDQAPQGEIDVVKKLILQHLNIDDKESCTIRLSFHQSNQRVYIMNCKTYGDAQFRVFPEGAAAVKVGLDHNNISPDFETVCWLLQATGIPHDLYISSNDVGMKPLDFEWTLEVWTYPISLGWQWQKVSFRAKQDLVEKIARYQAELLDTRNRFDGIGKIQRFATTDDRQRNQQRVPKAVGSIAPLTTRERFCVGKMTTASHARRRMDTTWVPQGPFHRVSDWLTAILNSIIKDLEFNIANPKDYVAKCVDPYGEDDWGKDEYEKIREDLRLAKYTGERLLEKISAIFPPNLDDGKEFALWHPSLSAENIHIDGQANMTSICGWERAHTVPLWHCYQVPQFLQGGTRARKPLPHHYEKPAPNSRYNIRARELPETAGNEYLYETHMKEYEKTRLRHQYLRAIEGLHPGFRQKMKHYQALNDFVFAVSQYVYMPDDDKVKKWVDASDVGTSRTLMKEMQDRFLERQT